MYWIIGVSGGRSMYTSTTSDVDGSGDIVVQQLIRRQGRRRCCGDRWSASSGRSRENSGDRGKHQPASTVLEVGTVGTVGSIENGNQEGGSEYVEP